MDGIGKVTVVCDPEAALMAEIEDTLERQESVNRHARRSAQALRRELVHAEAQHQHEAADEQFASSACAAAGKAAGAACDLVGALLGDATAKWLGPTGRTLGAASDGIAASYGRAADHDEATASEEGALAQDAAGLADECGDAAAHARGLEDKVLTHLADIADARRQAQLASTRG